MSDDVISDSAGLSGPVVEESTPRTRSIASTSAKAVEKIEEETPEIENVEIAAAEETVVNDDGEEVITAPKAKRRSRRSNSFTNEDGVVGSHAADAVLAKAEVEEVEEPQNPNSTGVWSEKNIRWSGVGELHKGYNIVTKEAAEKWVARKPNIVRIATPQEIASHYGK